MVGVRGFEPPTPSSRRKCATRLRYTPHQQILASPQGLSIFTTSSHERRRCLNLLDRYAMKTTWACRRLLLPYVVFSREKSVSADAEGATAPVNSQAKGPAEIQHSGERL